MVNGFLVRADGALIAIDHILYIQKEPIPDGTWHVKVYLTGEISVQWNKDPLYEREADDRLKLLQKSLREAMKHDLSA